MKKSGITILFVLLPVFGLLLQACRPEQESSFKGGQVEVTLFADTYRDVTVKSPASDAEGRLDWVWALQFSGDDILLDESGRPLISGPVLNTPASSVCSLPIKIDSRASKVVYIANADLQTDFSAVRTMDDLERISLAWTATDGQLAAGGFVMSGVWESDNPDPLHVMMERAVAKIDFTLRVAPELSGRNEAFALSSIRLKKVPAVSYLFRDAPSGQVPAEGTAFPELPFDTLNYEEMTYHGTCWPDELWMPTSQGVDAEVIDEQGESWLWYVPENARGTGSAADQNLKTEATAPAGQGGYCTYVEIKGYYNVNGLVNGVTYRVWLGENNYADYNLLRNTCYNVTATIQGQYAIDTRVNEKDPLNYFDYTEDGTAWMMIARESEGANMECPEGWRLPTKEEAMLAWIYEAQNPELNTTEYWWVDFVPGSVSGEDASWAIYMRNGQVRYEPGQSSSGGTTYHESRCVKEN